MKKIRLRVVPPSDETLDEVANGLSDSDRKIVREKLTIKYHQLLLGLLRSPMNPQAGVGIEEMEKSLDIIKLLKDLKERDVLELEEEQHQFLLKKLEVMRFNAVDERLVTFVHTIKNATADLIDDGPVRKRSK
jgi:hypothetical protein